MKNAYAPQNKVSYKFIMLLLCMSTTIPSMVKAQETLNFTGFSINPKAGYYFGGEGGIMAGAEFNYLMNPFIISADFYRYEEFIIFGPTPAESFNQLGIMFGKYKGDRYFRFQYQAGLAAFWGLKRTELESNSYWSDDYDSKNFTTVGVTTKLGFKVVPLTFLSIGIDLQTNINLERPLLVPSISIEIGRIRNKINTP